jgi:hypothetical protein
MAPEVVVAEAGKILGSGRGSVYGMRRTGIGSILLQHRDGDGTREYQRPIHEERKAWRSDARCDVSVASFRHRSRWLAVLARTTCGGEA